ncbi:MAG: hypothetical protein IT348_01015, partial [Candidatus Eisenbacteria bacterium]|nr:hypothetical protein [Candidatus Eisenbacteria bacterium]
LRVRSNSPSATAAVITSFAQEGVPTAWVDADFGGAVRATQSLELSAVDEVSLGGITPAPAGPDPMREPAPKPAAAKPAPVKPVPAPVAKPVVVTKPVAPKPVAPDTAAIARAARRAEARVRATAERHTRDSLAAVRRKREREERDARAAAARAAAKPVPKPAVTPGVTPDNPPARRAPEQEEDAAPSPVATPAPVVPAPARPANPRVFTIEPFAPAPAAGAPDTCACRLRGTVELDWERPLEKDVPVELTLEGPARQSTSVDLFMGPPREFRLGPLPCGDYRLLVKARGKYRYALVRGDSVVTVRCEGHTQTRVVLEPARR